MPTYKITAYSNIEERRVHLFRWTSEPLEGIAMAKEHAVKFGRDEELSDFQAERVK